MSQKAIEGLNPTILWQRFYEISQIPRPSKHEEKIVDYLKKFAKKHNLQLKVDTTNNVVIKIPASKGYENKPTVVLQAHVDMVCEKNKGTNHDFENEQLKLIREGEWIKADGTTLGADNGIGVAAALSIATDNSLEHGPIELLFTVDEETGLTGANNLKPNFIDGKMLLNLDSEEDGVFYVGCAGGVDTVGTYKIEFEDPYKDFIPYEILLTGLKGGHSGLNIADGRANAIKLMARFLSEINGFQFQIASFTGGSKRNAIPRESEVVILIEPKSETLLKEDAKKFVQEALYEYEVNDSLLAIKIEKRNENVGKVFSKGFFEKILNVLLALPHGVISMSPHIKGLVETSTNLATITIENDLLKIGTSQRSSIESAKEAVCRSVKAVFELSGAQIEVGDGYPGWKPNMDSKVLRLAKEVYRQKFNKEAEIKAIHAGLECGILGDKYPGLDMISFGPTIIGAHSPDEKVNIRDVEKFYNLLKAILIKIASAN
ncbi:aminoacyl-histidine dipeptidase [Melioribacteraceae bacterium 4301-Me]|uniref:aminoacyl-histidine dipeptidase n=1 Tax=Pyranulibacter aquaticus TaxID=3163344 RepID=UPI00359AB43A